MFDKWCTDCNTAYFRNCDQIQMGTGIIFASIPQTDSMQTTPSIWRHRCCKCKKTELVEGRTIAFHGFDWVVIPAVLQGRDFSDELCREKQEMKKWTHGQQVSQIYCGWNHLEETCCGLIFPLLRPFTARSQMVMAKTASGSEYLMFTNQKSIPVICVYHDLKARTVTGFCLTPIKKEKKRTRMGYGMVLLLQLYWACCEKRCTIGLQLSRHMQVDLLQ